MEGGWLARFQDGRRRHKAKEGDVDVIKRLLRDAFADLMALRTRVDALVASRAKSDAQERARIGAKMDSQRSGAIHVDGKEACAILTQKYSRTDGRMDVEWAVEGWKDGNLDLHRMVIEAELPRGSKLHLAARGVHVTELAPTLHVAEDGNGRDGRMGNALHQACQGGGALAWHWMDPIEHFQCCLGAFEGRSPGRKPNSVQNNNKNLFGQVTARAADGRLALALCAAQHGLGKVQTHARAFGMQVAATLTEDLAASAWASVPWKAGIRKDVHSSSMHSGEGHDGITNKSSGPSDLVSGGSLGPRPPATCLAVHSDSLSSWPFELCQSLFGLSITGTTPGYDNQLWGLSVGRVSTLPCGTWPFPTSRKHDSHAWRAEAFLKVDTGEGTTLTPRFSVLHHEERLLFALGASLEWEA